MVRVRLRTKLLLSLILTSTALIFSSLFIVQHQLRERAREEIFESLRNSVVTFQSFQRARQNTLARSAALLANLPSLKALMTTEHEATIQDASADFWRLAGSDLFVLADRTGKIVALETAAGGFDRQAAQASLTRVFERHANRDWWFGEGHLYEVYLQPIYFGAPSEDVPLGVVAVGYEINDQVANEVRRVASSQVGFLYGNEIVVSTLTPEQQAELAGQIGRLSPLSPLGAHDLQLSDERYLGSAVDLPPTSDPSVQLTVLKSYDQATAFLESLNRLLLVVGLAAVLAGTALVFLISHTFTRPLANLVSGVRALEKGDFMFPLDARTHDEIGELTTAFDKMRRSLEKSQRDLLHADRLATIGRMASSISHDLRHPLTAILAYAEFLAEDSTGDQQRKELYDEIRLSVTQMTDLISSLLEFSRAQEVLKLAYGNIREPVEHAIRTVQARPEFRGIAITLSQPDVIEGWFDRKRLERAFHNLLLNACEAVPANSGKIQVSTCRLVDSVEIRIADNGPGIPEAIRDSLFQPFVSYGKENGTGLGLAVAHKIVQDHGGEIRVDSPAECGAVFNLRIPLTPPSGVQNTS
ncbi:MAG: HAMP domain-containing histidine kinase [Acidobacteriia bacterium]|nr:HAMP domain-containing histidine kinase [Terriglobia bacterium]